MRQHNIWQELFTITITDVCNWTNLLLQMLLLDRGNSFTLFNSTTGPDPKHDSAKTIVKAAMGSILIYRVLWIGQYLYWVTSSYK